MRFLLNLIINVLSVVLTAYIVPGVFIDDLFTALLVAVVLGLLNTFVKPILVILTLPLTIVTLGIFYLFINVILVYATAALVPGFALDSFVSVLVFSILLSLINSFLNKLA